MEIHQLKDTKLASTSTAIEQLIQELLQEQRTWLITGVAGFIGSHLLQSLLKLDQRVVGIDNFSTGSQRNLNDVLSSVTSAQKNNFNFYEGDIVSLDDCQKVTNNVDYVLHHAAVGSIPRSIETPDITHASNATGFLNMLISARDANVKRFVYASSSSIYGDSTDLPKNEQKIGNPLSPYAVSKYINELYSKTFSICYGTETIGLRYFNVFGKRQDPNGPYAAVIPKWINAILKAEPVYIYGDGETTRDFSYIENVVQANLLAATTQNPDAINRVYNIAVGEQNSLNQLYDTLVECLNLPNQPKPIYQSFRKGDIQHSVADISMAKSLLGYVVTHPFKKGIESLLAHHQMRERIFHQ